MQGTAPQEGLQAPTMAPPPTEVVVPPAPNMYPAPPIEASAGAPPIPDPLDPGHLPLNFHGSPQPVQAQPTISMAEAGAWGQPQNPNTAGVAPGTEPVAPPPPTPDQGNSPFSTIQSRPDATPINYSAVPPAGPPAAPITYSEVPQAAVAPAPLGGQPTTYVSSPPPEAYSNPQPPVVPQPTISMQEAGAWAQPQNPNAPISSFVSVPATPEVPQPKAEPSFASMPPLETQVSTPPALNGSASVPAVPTPPENPLASANSESQSPEDAELEQYGKDINILWRTVDDPELRADLKARWDAKLDAISDKYKLKSS